MNNRCIPYSFWVFCWWGSCAVSLVRKTAVGRAGISRESKPMQGIGTRNIVKIKYFLSGGKVWDLLQCK